MLKKAVQYKVRITDEPLIVSGVTTSEQHMLETAAQLLGVQPEDVLKAGVLAYLKRLFTHSLNPQNVTSVGKNNAIYLKAFNAFLKEGFEPREITPTILGRKSGTRSYRTAKKWLEHHIKENYNNA